MARDEDEAVAEGMLGMAEVPAHDAAEGGRDHERNLGARAAGVTGLAQVQHEVDRLVDEVADLLPLGEVGGEGLEGGLVEGLHAVRGVAPGGVVSTI